jgi:small ligand-binding sensory domain FIST
MNNKNINYEQNMKTLIPLTLAALALAAITLNVSAGEALLSPRASDLQIRNVPGVDKSPNTVTLNRNIIASPRTIDNQIKVVKSTGNNPDTLVCRRQMLASPKAIGECASHPGVAMACCSVAMTK